MPETSKSVCVYSDEGASETCVYEWRVRLRELGLPVREIFADDIVRGDLQHARALIMPGGADVPYCQKLTGAGNEAIVAFVREGGLYIGSCAGAYYAHQAIDWRNAEERIAGERELAFFEGVARGPLLVPYSALSSEGLAFVQLRYRDMAKALVYYKGGPIMHVCNKSELMASFTHKGLEYPAVVKKRIGRGVAVAMSPHIEYTEAFLHSIGAPACPHRCAVFLAIMRELFN